MKLKSSHCKEWCQINIPKPCISNWIPKWEFYAFISVEQVEKHLFKSLIELKGRSFSVSIVTFWKFLFNNSDIEYMKYEQSRHCAITTAFRSSSGIKKSSTFQIKWHKWKYASEEQNVQSYFPPPENDDSSRNNTSCFPYGVFNVTFWQFIFPLYIICCPSSSKDHNITL